MPLSAEDAKKELISTLMTEAKGMTARQLYGNFRELVGEIIPFAKFGFSSIENYMRSFPDVVRISRNTDGEEIYSVIATQSTQHIAAMKRCERTKNARRSRLSYPRHWTKTTWRQPRLQQQSQFVQASRPPLLVYPYQPRPRVVPVVVQQTAPPPLLGSAAFERPRSPFILMPGVGYGPLHLPPPPIFAMGPPAMPYPHLSASGHMIFTDSPPNYYGNQASSVVCNSGGQTANLQPKPSNVTPASTSTTDELKSAVIELLQSHRGGLIDTELVKELVTCYPHLALPAHLLALVDDWTDVLEIVCVPGKATRILALRLDYNPAAMARSEAATHSGNEANKMAETSPGALMLPQSNQWNIYVCCVNSSVDVIVRLVGEGYSDRLDELEAALSNELDRTPDSGGGGVTVNSVCALRVRADDGTIDWYRVCVINIEDNGRARVTLVDHGGSEVVSMSCLYPLSASFLTLPFQALSCKLTGLGRYSSCRFMTDTLIDRTVGKILVADVDNRIGQPSLTLWHTSEDVEEEDVNINAAVLEMLCDSEKPPMLPEVGDSVEVTVSHVTTIGDIYVQLVGPGMVRLRHVMAELEDFYDGKMSDASLFVLQPQLDNVYVVQSGAEFKRAKVTKVIGKRSEVEVLYVDFGDTDTVSLLVVRQFAPSLEALRDFPHQAIRCQSYDYPVSSGLWGHEVSDKVMQRLSYFFTCWLEVLARDADQLPLVDFLIQDANDMWQSVLVDVVGLLPSDDPAVTSENEGISQQISAFLSSYIPPADSSEADPASLLVPLSKEAPIMESGDRLIVDALCNNLRMSAAPTEAFSSANILPPAPDFNLRELTSSGASVMEAAVESILAPPPGLSAREPVALSPELFVAFQSMAVSPGLPATSQSVSQAAGDAASITLVKPLVNAPQSTILTTEKLTTGDRVTVTWVVNPGHIVLTKTLNKSLVSKMHTNMSQLADKQMLSVRDVWPGLPVAVYVSEESLWFRAVVQQLQTGAKGSTQVKVFLVDYGDHEVVSLANVRPLPAQFTSLPSQAVRTRLAGVRPADNCMWSKESANWLVTRAQGKEMEVQILASALPDLDINHNTALPVHLVDNGHFIHQELVEADYAVTGDNGLK